MRRVTEEGEGERVRRKETVPKRKKGLAFPHRGKLFQGEGGPRPRVGRLTSTIRKIPPDAKTPTGRAN